MLLDSLLEVAHDPPFAQSHWTQWSSMAVMYTIAQHIYMTHGRMHIQQAE
jgi:hypothetical protein